jgi:uncharacterized protein (TIGR00730 family)
MRVAVFCGESSAHEHIVSAAAALGRLCAERRITLVCFGTSAVAACGRACQSAGGTVVTVLNQATLNSLSSDVVSSLPNIIVGADVHACKALSYALGDAVLVLPGGLEIIDAAFEAACWSQLGCHGAVGRPVGMLNIDNFFVGILKQVAHGVQTGFIHQKFGNLQVTADTPEKVCFLSFFCGFSIV